MNESNNGLSDNEFVIECDPFIIKRDVEEDNCYDNDIEMSGNIDNDCNEINDETEILLIENQSLRNGLDLNKCLKSKANEELSKTEIWKIERMDSSLRLIDNDCHKMISFSPIIQTQFKEIKDKINEIIRDIEIIQEFKLNDDSNYGNILSKSFGKSEDHILKENELNKLNEEVNQIEKQIALLDVFKFENQRVFDTESELETKIEDLKKENTKLEREVLALKISQKAFMQ